MLGSSGPELINGRGSHGGGPSMAAERSWVSEPSPFGPHCCSGQSSRSSSCAQRHRYWKYLRSYGKLISTAICGEEPSSRIISVLPSRVK